MSDANELSVSCHIDAPPERVWDVMVNRQEEGGARRRGGRKWTGRSAVRAAPAT